MLAEGIPAAVIENAARFAGMPVGPLAVIDETSMSLSVHVMDQTLADLAGRGRSHCRGPGQGGRADGEGVDRPGRAAGGGFYEYPRTGKKFLWPELANIFAKPGVAYDIEELKDRMLYRQAIETARCLAEGVLTTVLRNIGSIFGIGFPAWTGGAMQFVASEGRGTFCADARCARPAPRRPLRDLRAKRSTPRWPRRSAPQGLRKEPPLPRRREGSEAGRVQPRYEVRVTRERLRFNVNVHCASLLRLGLVDLRVRGHIGTAPHTPQPPFISLAHQLGRPASGWPAYCAATSL